MIPEPLVSFVVNCYNGEKYLKKCLSSILAQTYSNWELVFWDNASTDKSVEIFNSYKDSRFIYFCSEKNVNLGQARAWAVEKCKGDFIAFLDIDDEWLPNKTSIQIERMLKEDSYLSYSGVYLKTMDGISSTSIPKYSSGHIFDKQLERFEINMPSSIIKTEALRALNINFDPRVIASEEYDLFMHIAAVYKISVIKEVLSIYRLATDSLTNNSLQHRANDKMITISKLENKFPEEVLKNRKHFSKAKAKINYYRFQFYYREKQYFKARSELKSILFIDIRYFLIYISLFIFPKFYSYVLKKHDGRGL